jgi:ubiquinone/menaquinone biosynthesis C-methylase UbiE
MLAAETMKAGDFTKLAGFYSKYRPKYSEQVLSALLGLVNKPINQIDFADIGAGTGIWTRMISQRNLRSVIAVEPNNEMKKEGEASNGAQIIQWLSGSAETTGLKNESLDMLSMASSFHWADFDVATKEFHRVLRPGGFFVALWNPRYLEISPLLMEIESKITELEPTIKRVSSGNSKHVDELAIRLKNCNLFSNTIYLEDMHHARLTPEQYIGAWESVNDVRVQLGEVKFQQFMDFVRQKVERLPWVDCHYLTRAWAVQKEI